MDTYSSENNNNYELQEKDNFFRKYLAFVLIGILLLLIAIVYFALMLLSNNKTSDTNTPLPTPTIAPSSTFSVVSTSPADNETDVYPGEISITFDTNTPLLSQGDYSIRLDPAPEIIPITNNTFPTQTASYGIVGGLSQNTTYTVSIYNSSGQLVYSWSFTTSNEIPESSSREAKIEQENAIKNYYPLFYDLPYETSAFKIDYTDRLALEVIMYTGDQATIAPLVEGWIREKGVTPSSHTINYIVN